MTYGTDPKGRRRFPAFVPWVAAWLTLVVLVLVLTAQANVASGFAANAQSVSGTVVAKEPTNHATVRATYDVAGVAYVVADSFIGPPNPSFEAVQVGDQVTVYYDPAAPATAVLSEPRKRASNEIGFMVLAAIVLPSGFVGALMLAWILRKTLMKML